MGAFAGITFRHNAGSASSSRVKRASTAGGQAMRRLLTQFVVAASLWSSMAIAQEPPALGGFPERLVGAEDGWKIGDVAGKYGSTRCVLELKRNGDYLLACTDQPLREGRAVAADRGLVLLDDVRHTPSGIPWRHKPSRIRWPPRETSPAWPAVQDPTSGPYKFPDTFPDIDTQEQPWLEPVRWGERLYLVRPAERASFCRAILSRVEPRRTMAGHQLLRSGDERKRAARGAPDICPSTDK